MVNAYLRERFPLWTFAPLAMVIAAAGSARWLTIAGLGLDTVFAGLLLAQFRTWDDLADRGHDASAHPNRVLVKAPSVTNLIAFCGALAVLNICLAVWRDATGIAVGTLAALNATLGSWYLARTTRSAAGDYLLLSKYPAMVLIVAGGGVLDAPVRIVAAAAGLYAAVCIYEGWHDPTSPLHAAPRLGGRS